MIEFSLTTVLTPKFNIALQYFQASSLFAKSNATFNPTPLTLENFPFELIFFKFSTK